MGELIPVATFQKNGLWDKKMVPYRCSKTCCFMTIKKECVVNLLVSTRHTYITNNALVIVQVMRGADPNLNSMRYHFLVPKDVDNLRLKLKYKSIEDNHLNLYMECSDPVVSILSVSDISCVETKNEVITEFPQDAIDAVEV